MANWTSWKSLIPSVVARAPKTRFGVYEIALDGRRYLYGSGWSATVYYGHTLRSIHVRLHEHFSGRGNPTVKELLQEDMNLKVRWWTTARGPRPIECRLLEQFSYKFGELPLGNVIGCDISGD